MGRNEKGSFTFIRLVYYIFCWMGVRLFWLVMPICICRVDVEIYIVQDRYFVWLFIWWDVKSSQMGSQAFNVNRLILIFKFCREINDKFRVTEYRFHYRTAWLVWWWYCMILYQVLIIWSMKNISRWISFFKKKKFSGSLVHWSRTVVLFIESYYHI